MSAPYRRKTELVYSPLDSSQETRFKTADAALRQVMYAHHEGDVFYEEQGTRVPVRLAASVEAVLKRWTDQRISDLTPDH